MEKWVGDLIHKIIKLEEIDKMKTKPEAKHTNGEWSFVRNDKAAAGIRGTITSFGKYNTTLKIAAVDENEVGTNEAVANGCLIAAAPDLLEALKRIMQIFPEHGLDWEKEDRLKIEKAKAAIEKAEASK